MGGLMSLYALLEYNHVFGRAAALSPSIWTDTEKISEMIERAEVAPDTVLYLDYGDRIKGASKADQTFLVQLASAESGTYLPSRRSGTTGYGNTPQSCIVTPEAGDTIVKESVKEINRMFE